MSAQVMSITSSIVTSDAIPHTQHLTLKQDASTVKHEQIFVGLEQGMGVISIDGLSDGHI
eukprot:15354385-Ditylum_brightwellii.AAC.1